MSTGNWVADGTPPEPTFETNCEFCDDPAMHNDLTGVEYVFSKDEDGPSFYKKVCASCLRKINEGSIDRQSVIRI